MGEFCLGRNRKDEVNNTNLSYVKKDRRSFILQLYYCPKFLAGESYIDIDIIHWGIIYGANAR